MDYFAAGLFVFISQLKKVLLLQYQVRIQAGQNMKGNFYGVVIFHLSLFSYLGMITCITSNINYFDISIAFHYLYYSLFHIIIHITTRIWLQQQYCTALAQSGNKTYVS